MGGMALGLFGGFIGIAASMFVMAGGLVALWGGALGLAASSVGMGGGAMAVRRPLVAAVLMVLAGIAGLVGTHQFFVVSGAMFLLGGIATFIARD